MVILPFGFTATKYPGYFWDTRKHKLYSLKICGELREIKMTRMSEKWWKSLQREDGYRVSHRGQRRWLYVSDLKKLTPADSVIQVVGPYSTR